MYQILGVQRALTYFGLLSAAVFAIWAKFDPPSDWTSISAIWKLASGAVTVAALIVTVFGQTPLFPLICRLPLIRSWLPPLDGEWKATLESNWPVIQQRAKPDEPPSPLIVVGAKVTIRARLFYLRMNLVSDDRYSISKTIFVRPSRDPEDGSVQLHYVYENSTIHPKATDSGAHCGAASMTVQTDGGGIWLEGTYWTNRNWHLGMNTAGKITLRKPA